MTPDAGVAQWYSNLERSLSDLFDASTAKPTTPRDGWDGTGCRHVASRWYRLRSGVQRRMLWMRSCCALWGGLENVKARSLVPRTCERPALGRTTYKGGRCGRRFGLAAFGWNQPVGHDGRRDGTMIPSENTLCPWLRFYLSHSIVAVCTCQLHDGPSVCRKGAKSTLAPFPNTSLSVS